MYLSAQRSRTLSKGRGLLLLWSVQTQIMTSVSCLAVKLDKLVKITQLSQSEQKSGPFLIFFLQKYLFPYNWHTILYSFRCTTWWSTFAQHDPQVYTMMIHIIPYSMITTLSLVTICHLARLYYDWLYSPSPFAPIPPLPSFQQTSVCSLFL